MRRTTCLSLALCIAAGCADLPPITSPDNNNTETTAVSQPSTFSLRGYVRRAEVNDASPWAWNLELRSGAFVPLSGADAMLESRENTDVLVVGTFVDGALKVQSCSAATENPEGEMRRGRRGR
jgi:hypothetical protein